MGQALAAFVATATTQASQVMSPPLPTHLKVMGPYTPVATNVTNVIPAKVLVKTKSTFSGP